MLSECADEVGALKTATAVAALRSPPLYSPAMKPIAVLLPAEPTARGVASFAFVRMGGEWKVELLTWQFAPR